MAHSRPTCPASERIELGPRNVKRAQEGLERSGLARAVNRVFRRRGPVLRDRFHHVVLKSPTEVRNALRYVLMNARRHRKRPSRTVRIDPASSGRWFEGWKRSARAIVLKARERPGIHAIATPHTWLLNEGWKKAGPPLDPGDSPG